LFDREFRLGEQRFIKIGGAREHNLKNLTLNIPRTSWCHHGLSGSASRRRVRHHSTRGPAQNVESPRLRPQFLDRCQKPEVGLIEGLSSSNRHRYSGSSGSKPALDHRHDPEFTITAPALRPHRQPHLPGHRRAHRLPDPSDIWTKSSRCRQIARQLLAPVVRRQKGRVPRRDRAARAEASSVPA